MSDSEFLKLLVGRVMIWTLRNVVAAGRHITLFLKKAGAIALSLAKRKLDERPDIYVAGRASRGNVYLATSGRKLYLYKGLRYLGAGMVSFSITALIYSYSPLVELTLFGRDITAPGNASASEGQGEVVQLPLSDGPRELPKFEQVRTDSSGELLEVKREAEAYGIGTAFAIAIPKIGAYSDVVAQVDINKKEEYLEAMLTGVAHAKQTSYPDEAGITYLFAHSTNSPLYIEQYNAVFYRLRELTIGDNVIVFYKSRRYEYRVIESAVVEVDDTEWVNSDDPTPRLVLQTSHPPGTVWKRLLVIAEPVE